VGVDSVGRDVEVAGITEAGAEAAAALKAICDKLIP